MADSDDLRSMAERASQYEPAPQPGASSVTDQLLCYVDCLRVPEEQRTQLWRMLQARREMGRAKYGCELQTYNGRNAWTDCLQELLDAAVYITQARMEGRPVPGEIRSVLHLVSNLIMDFPR
jgi:hypothetical protein